MTWSFGQEESIAITQSTALSHTITGLNAGTHYMISVSANNAAGSAESDRLTTMTGRVLTNSIMYSIDLYNSHSSWCASYYEYSGSSE